MGKLEIGVNDLETWCNYFFVAYLYKKSIYVISGNRN